MPVVLLDTHALLFLDTGAPMAQAALEAIEAARPGGGVLVAPVSAWEIGMLVHKGRLRLDRDPVGWFQRFLGQAGVRLAPMTVEAAAGASMLPGAFHGDPADRLLVAAARQLGVPLVTRDRLILAYADATAALRVIAC